MDACENPYNNGFYSGCMVDIDSLQVVSLFGIYLVTFVGYIFYRLSVTIAAYRSRPIFAVNF